MEEPKKAWGCNLSKISQISRAGNKCKDTKGQVQLSIRQAMSLLVIVITTVADI